MVEPPTVHARTLATHTQENPLLRSLRIFMCTSGLRSWPLLRPTNPPTRKCTRFYRFASLYLYSLADIILAMVRKQTAYKGDVSHF